MRPSPMNHSMPRFGLVLAALALAGCSSIPLMGPGSMELQIKGVELEEVTSLFVIVGDQEDLADVEEPRTIEKVVLPERQSKYATFGQFKPVKGKNWVFQQRVLKPSHPQIDVSLEEEEPELTVEIDRDILEPRPQLAAAVVVNCGERGWHAYPLIPRSQIESIDTLKLEVRGITISIAGSSKASKDLPVAPPK